MDWNSRLPLTIPQVLAVADTIPSRLFLWRNKMNEEIMNEIQPVRPKDQFCWTSAMNKPITDTKYPYIHIFKKIGGQTE